MPKHLLRPLLIVEFLIALEVIYTAWSQIGGQVHLDLMFWPWKLGIGFGAAWLITAITGNIVKNGGEIKRRVYIYASLLCLVLATAGLVTWYYHMHEPVDQQEDEIDDEVESITPAVFNKAPATRSPAVHAEKIGSLSMGCTSRDTGIVSASATSANREAAQKTGDTAGALARNVRCEPTRCGRLFRREPSAGLLYSRRPLGIPAYLKPRR
jgi:hypothetical protein